MSKGDTERERERNLGTAGSFLGREPQIQNTKAKGQLSPCAKHGIKPGNSQMIKITQSKFTTHGKLSSSNSEHTQ